MKKIYLLLIGVVLCFHTFSEPVDIKTATKVALNFMKQQTNGKSFTVKEVIAETSDSVICYYTITFNEGGWVIVSADNSVKPILGYSPNGKIDKTKSKPDNFIEWTKSYKKQIIAAGKLNKISAEVKTKWNNLTNNNSISKLLPTTHTSSILTSSYVPGTALLNTPDRGEIMWSQTFNNDDHCSPSYNMFCYPGGSSCDCGNYASGCGAVAMGQIMWYWRWPIYTNSYSFNWNIMPNALYDNTPYSQASEVAKLLMECGETASMSYGCNASWTTMNHLVDAFIYFKYNAIDKIKRSDWPDDVAWKKLIRAEIDAGRPVLYRGGNFLPSSGESLFDWGDIHYFDCDGYEIQSSDYYFHFNWGWWGDYNGFYNIDNLLVAGSNYTNDQMAIIGISPTCGTIANDINDVSYSYISGSKAEYAYNTISLPASGKTLTVNSGGNYSLGAGMSIKLNPGFSAKNGSVFKAYISNLNCSNDCGMSVTAWTNWFSCPINGCDYLCYDAGYANTFQFQAYDNLGQLVYANAGYITGYPVYVWDDCSAYFAAGWYTCNITFRDNCGEKISNSYNIYYPGTLSKYLNDSNSGLSNIDITNTVFINISPNPNNGIFTISKTGNSDNINNIEIYNILSNKIYQSDFETNTKLINISQYPKGIYIVKVYSGNEVFVEKVVYN